MPVRLMYQHTPALSLGIAYGERVCGEAGFSYKTIAFSLENSLDFNQPYLSPQIGWFAQYNMFETYLNFAGYYSKNRDPDYRVIPEIGFSPYGKLGISFGYGISLSRNVNDYISPFRVGITYVLDEDPTKNI